MRVHRLKGRICAVRKSLAARKASRIRCLRENSKKGRKVKRETLEAAEYVTVFTTLHQGFLAETIMQKLPLPLAGGIGIQKTQVDPRTGKTHEIPPRGRRGMVTWSDPGSCPDPSSHFCRELFFALGICPSETANYSDRSMWREIFLMIRFFLRAIILWTGMCWCIRN
jgi:hypothetical protein